jgi:hypothetical protein
LGGFPHNKKKVPAFIEPTLTSQRKSHHCGHGEDEAGIALSGENQENDCLGSLK